MTLPPLTPMKTAAARLNATIGTKLVAETGGMRIWHMRLLPGESLAPHRHDRPYFWTVIGDGQERSRFGDGRIVDVTYRAGETRHHPDLGADNSFVHDLTNTGTTELVFVTVEFDRP